MTEVDEDREFGADLHDGGERCSGIVPPGQGGDDPQMGAGGDWQELGEALHHAQHDGVQPGKVGGHGEVGGHRSKIRRTPSRLRASKSSRVSDASHVMLWLRTSQPMPISAIPPIAEIKV
ncbi:unannotated protein [freshwater metagenome]|uniref:Unannotated protein n=1 Tax=freshwater metagenome TaxID=449393 RepID=A0A6J7KQB7_9ZZZZ